MSRGNVLVGLGVGMLGLVVGTYVLKTTDHYLVKPVKSAIYNTVHKLHPGAVEKVGAERGRAFSDFSNPAAWPAADATAMRQGIEKGRAKVFAEVKQKTHWTTAELDSYGAQVWGLLAASGVSAYDMLRDDRGQMVPESNPALVLTDQFLAKRCDQKVEIACLDLAKRDAAAISGRNIANQENIDRGALARIPPWLKTAEANELRTRISSQGGFWRYLEKTVR